MTVIDDREPPVDEYADTTPHNYDAEADVLGGILYNPRTLNEVSLVLDGRAFYSPAHELIYDAIEHLYARGLPVDVTTVTAQLGPNLERAGGHDRIRQLHHRGTGIPDPAWHAEIVAKTAARRRLDAVGTRIKMLARNTGDGSVADLFDAAEAELAAIPRTVPGVDLAITTSWAPQDLAPVLAHGEILTQPTLLRRTDGQCLLYPAAVHSISGEPESGKTWVALIAAAQILRDDIPGYEGALVTYVDFEDRAGRVIPRLLHLGAPAHAIAARFKYIRPAEALTAAGGKALDAVAAESPLAIVDGVTEAMTMHGFEVNDNGDAAKFLAMLPRRLSDNGCSVLQIDHVVKDSDGRGRYAIGAQHKLAGLDGVSYGVKVMHAFARGKAGRAALSIHKDREGAVREVALGNSIGQLVIDSTGDLMTAFIEEPRDMPRSADGDERPTHLMEKVSRHVEQFPGSSRGEIERGVGGKLPWVRKAIDALVRENYLTVTAGPRNSHLHHVVAMYREADDADA